MLFIWITQDERYQGLLKNVTKDVADTATIKTNTKKSIFATRSPNKLHAVTTMLNRTRNVRITLTMRHVRATTVVIEKQ